MNNHFRENVEAVKHLILPEVNVKDLEFMEDDKILMKKIKPNFKTLGPRYGKLMKSINAALISFDNEQIGQFETAGKYNLHIEGQEVEILISDVEILTEDIPGWLISSTGNLTVAMDITITDDLKHEGIARELVNRIQNLRKENQFEVTDKISLLIEKTNELEIAVQKNFDYICSETLADSLQLTDQILTNNKITIELTDEMKTNIIIEKHLN
jgi:isoleucyl-tRNA synthetase